MNIYEVAKEANVSIATVSRVMNNKGNVRAATAERVREILRKHNYQPNASAVAMATNQSMTIAIITVDIRIPHYANTTYVIERFFSAEDYHVLVCNTGAGLESTRKTIEIVTAKKVDGIIFVGSVFNTVCKDEYITNALRNIPVVLANGYLDWEMASSVLANDGLGIAMTTNHLLEQGCRRVSYVRDLETDSAFVKARHYAMVMEEHGLEPQILETSFGFRNGMDFGAEILPELKYCDAVVFGEDMTAAGAVKLWRQRGIRVGYDLLVTACNNTLESQISEPPLTTIDNKGTEIALKCAQLMLEILQNKHGAGHLEVLPDMILRESTEGRRSEAQKGSASGAAAGEIRIAGEQWHREHPEYPLAIERSRNKAKAKRAGLDYERI